jgi:multidrug efflux system outer membrane protein
MLHKLLTALLLTVLTAGCSMMPKYQQPELPVVDSWPAGAAYSELKTETSAVVGWQDYVQSETLRQLIGRVLENNRDLKIAALNIEKAQAAYRIQRSGQLPTVSAGVTAVRAGVPEDISSYGTNYNYTTVAANIATASYELDFFGRIKSLNGAALETYLATEEAMASSRISLIAETANAYLSYLADKQLLVLAEETCSTQQETYRVVERQFEVGSATRLALAQSATAVESAKVSIAQYNRQLVLDRNALDLFAGGSVADLLESGESIASIVFMKQLPVGLPSQVLLARPDIRQAEHQLKAANADIGAARAALYPSISLTGSFGLSSDSLDGLFTAGARYAWNFTPSLTLPIFSHGKLKASLAAAEVSEKIAAEQYQKTVQTAFREVADQLAARGTYRDQLEAQTALVAATSEAYELSKARYDNGIDNFLTLLDSQRALFVAQQGAVAVKQASLTNLVNLYKVLGGGQI